MRNKQNGRAGGADNVLPALKHCTKRALVQDNVEKPKETLDTHTQALHKRQAIPQNPRKSAVVVESYSGFESSLPDQLHFFVIIQTFRGDPKRPVGQVCGAGLCGPAPAYSSVPISCSRTR